MKKKILASILAVTTLATCAFSAVACNKEVPKDEVLSSVVEEVKGEGELVVNNVTTTPGMRLNIQRLAAQYTDTNENNGIATVAEDAYTLTATVLPEDAVDKTVTYTLTWQNPSSTWTKSKSVTDYVTLSQSNGSLNATIACNEAFGESIIVTVTSNNNPNAKATATLHYKQKIASYMINNTSGFLPAGSRGLADYTEYGSGTDNLTGTFTPDYEYDCNIDGRPSFEGQINKTTVYTRENDTVIGYMEIVPTAEFKEYLLGMGAVEEYMSCAAEGAVLKPAFFFDYNWFHTYGFGKEQTSEQVNSHINALVNYHGEAFKLNLYTAKNGTLLTSFTLTLDTSKLVTQKQVESVSLDNVEFEF